MDWGIHNVRPETVMETALEVDAPALVRGVRCYLQIAIFEKEGPKGFVTLGRRQTARPAKVA